MINKVNMDEVRQRMKARDTAPAPALDYVPVTAMVKIVGKMSVLVRTKAGNDAYIARSLIEPSDDLALSMAVAMKDATFRVRTFKAEEVGLV